MAANLEDFLPKLSPEEQARLDENRRRRDAQSKEMSDLLLKGWKMLGEHCPVTGDVPLMQHPKTGRKYSVAVGKYMDELHAPAADKPAPAPAAPAPVPPPANAPRANGVHGMPGVANASPQAMGRPGAIIPDEFPPMRYPPTQRSVLLPSAGAPEREAVPAVRGDVQAKMRALGSTLAELQDPDDIRSTLQLIEACARTLAALNGISVAPEGAQRRGHGA